MTPAKMDPDAKFVATGKDLGLIDDALGLSQDCEASHEMAREAMERILAAPLLKEQRKIVPLPNGPHEYEVTARVEVRLRAASISAAEALAARGKVLDELKADLNARFISSSNQWSKGRNSGLLECCNIINEHLRQPKQEQPARTERTCYGCSEYRIQPDLTFKPYCKAHPEKGEIDPDHSPDWCKKETRP